MYRVAVEAPEGSQAAREGDVSRRDTSKFSRGVERSETHGQQALPCCFPTGNHQPYSKMIPDGNI